MNSTGIAGVQARAKIADLVVTDEGGDPPPEPGTKFGEQRQQQVLPAVRDVQAQVLPALEDGSVSAQLRAMPASGAGSREEE